MHSEKDGLKAFEELPRRILLDTSIFHLFNKYGMFLFENIEPLAGDRIYRMSDGFAELDCLKGIFFLNQRSAFEFAISEQSLMEMAANRDGIHLQWAYEWFDYWNGCCESYDNGPFTGEGVGKAELLKESKFGYLSQKDRLLIEDALSFECHAFLTMDYKLQKNSKHLSEHLHLSILRPSDFWNLLKPWAGLFM